MMDESCMLTGLKTPQKHELLISRTTFMNFDSHNCIAITTCSGCYQGQDDYFTKAPGSLSQGLISHYHCGCLLLVYFFRKTRTDLRELPPPLVMKHFLVNDPCRLPQLLRIKNTHALLCSINIKERKFPIFSSNLTVTNSHNKVITVNYVSDTLSNANGWMSLLLDQEIYTLSFSSPLLQRNLQVWHVRVPSCSRGSLPTLPPLDARVSAVRQLGPNHIRQITGKGLIQVTFKVEDIFPLSEPGPVPSFSPPIFRWSLAESWNDVTMGWGGYNKSIPSADEDVIILP
ncbi:hypothetical protein Chor_015613, partial [Crotalus horridus]